MTRFFDGDRIVSGLMTTIIILGLIAVAWFTYDIGRSDQRKADEAVLAYAEGCWH